jgi:uncharacterized protein YegP (UPF0339 family)
MKKLIAAALVIGSGIIVSVSPGPTLAQAKKGAKTGTIEIIESKDGKYRFNVRDAEGKYLGGSALGHATEKQAKEAVEEMKKVLATAIYVSKKTEAKD